MAGNCCCSGVRRDINDTEFTVLLVHVLNVSHLLALEGSSGYTKQLVERFFRKYTKIDPARVEPHAPKFLRLNADSRLEIAFVGPPIEFQAPSYKIYKYEPSEALAAIFEVETRIIRRYVNPGNKYEELEIERTDYIPQYLSDYAHSRVACSESYYAVPREGRN